jgi:hypothetical protein
MLPGFTHSFLLPSVAPPVGDLITMRPDADVAADGWINQAGSATNIYQSIDETSAGDADYVRSPMIAGDTANLYVRLYEGATEIAEWSHLDIAGAYTTVTQTLTAPQFAAIGDLNDLFVEFDDDNGNVYRCRIGNPAAAAGEPFRVRYRYAKAVV